MLGHRATSRVTAKRAHGRHDNARGFTLMETVVALIVMMVVGLGATSLFFYSIRYNQGASDRAQAIAVAQQKLEELRAVDWDDAQLTATTGTALCTATAPCYSGGKAFTATKVITESNNVTVNSVTRPTVKTITISVTPVQSVMVQRNGQQVTLPTISVTAQRATILRGPY